MLLKGVGLEVVIENLIDPSHNVSENVLIVEIKEIQVCYLLLIHAHNS